MMRISIVFKPPVICLLLAFCACGCGDAGWSALADRFLPGRQANSDRTKHAYEANPLVVTEQDRRLQDYLNQLESIDNQGSSPGAYRPRRVEIPVLPRELDLEPDSSSSGPFSPGAATRQVRPPGEGPLPGRITPITPMHPSQSEIDKETGKIDDVPPPVGEVARNVTATGDSGGEQLFSPGEELSAEQIYRMLEPYRMLAEAEPNNLDRQLQLRLIMAAAGMREQALKPIDLLSESENRRVADLLMMIMALRNRPQLAPTPQEAAEQVDALERLRQKLQALADLKIPRLELCRTVNGYGNFENFPEYKFAPGAPMVVYCEVKNFSVEDRGDGRYSTVLDLELGLYDNLGVLVKPVQKDAGIEDISANRRNDFFLTTVYYVPPDLPPGDYILKAVIRDPRVNKIASRSVDVKVVSATEEN